MATRKVGRDAISGRFVSRRTTRRFPATTTVETMDVPARRSARTRRRAARHLTEEKQQERDFKAGKDI